MMFDTMQMVNTETVGTYRIPDLTATAHAVDHVTNRVADFSMSSTLPANMTSSTWMTPMKCRRAGDDRRRQWPIASIAARTTTTATSAAAARAKAACSGH